jgi:hypothetical protein
MWLRTRLRRLERCLPHGGCASCGHRRGLDALVAAELLPDGTQTYSEGHPTPCSACGEIPERIITIVEMLVEAGGGPKSAAAEPGRTFGDARPRADDQRSRSLDALGPTRNSEDS